MAFVCLPLSIFMVNVGKYVLRGSGYLVSG